MTAQNDLLLSLLALASLLTMSPPLEPHNRVRPDSASPNSDAKLGSSRSSRKSGAARKAPTRGGGGGGAAGGSPTAESKTPQASPSDAVPASRRADDSQAHPDSERPVKLGNSSRGLDSADISATDEHNRHCEDKERNEGAENFSVYCWDQFTTFFNQQKPHVDAFSAAMLDWRHKIQSLMRRAWPPLRSGSLIVGGIALTLGLMWLDCCIRGFKSLCRLGSAALFLLVCCTALNLGILAGFFKLLVALVLSLGTAFLFGYTPALAVIGTFSAVVLWLYGSFGFTGGIVVIGGFLFIADQPRLAMLVELLYSIYTAKRKAGWLGLFLCLNFSFIFSNLMIFFLHSNTSDTGGQGLGGTTSPSFGKDKNKSKSRNQSGSFTAASSPNGFQPSESMWTAGGASTSGIMEGELNFVDKEVERLVGCKDHYAVLGLDRYAEIDAAILKRDYRKKAMLVHPDKNLGNEVAEEAFKCLQNAYEVLLDPSKKQCYDEELKREEVLLILKRFQQEVRRNGRSGSMEDRCIHSEDEGENELSAGSRRITCKKCTKMHLWICTDRNKLHARWCQECQDYHQAKDGDGWIEQSVHALFFGIFQKVEAPRAFACADSKVYEVTEWVQCQGMKCPPNTHKPTFHVSTAGIAKGQARGTRASKGTFNNTAEGFLNETMTEEEFIKWLENAMASGVFNDVNEGPPQPETKGGNRTKSGRKKRKGKNK